MRRNNKIVKKRDSFVYLEWRGGFTLVELLIAIVIVGILTTAALPSYQRYLRRARFSELVQLTAPVKLAVEECYQSYGDLKECNSGKHGLATATAQADAKATISVTSGKITLTPNKNVKGLEPTLTYILTPTVNTDGSLRWSTGGEAVKEGVAY